MNKIEQFKGGFKFLNNFFPSPIIWKKVKWPTVEHAFQAAKTTSTYDFHKIRTATTPGIAKHIGSCIKLRENWEEIKIDMMTDLVWLKFKDPNLRDQLLLTNTRKLVEGNYWHDNFWGNCTCSNCSHIKGKNILGIILMEIRNELWKQE